MSQWDRGPPHGLGGGEKSKLRLTVSLPHTLPQPDLELRVESCGQISSHNSDHGISSKPLKSRDKSCNSVLTWEICYPFGTTHLRIAYDIVSGNDVKNVDTAAAKTMELTLDPESRMTYFCDLRSFASNESLITKSMTHFLENKLGFFQDFSRTRYESYHPAKIKPLLREAASSLEMHNEPPYLKVNIKNVQITALQQFEPKFFCESVLGLESLQALSTKEALQMLAIKAAGYLKIVLADWPGTNQMTDLPLTDYFKQGYSRQISKALTGALITPSQPGDGHS